jgi:protein-S-isoprenylcysteine O-methyltransferase Ste14
MSVPAQDGPRVIAIPPLIYLTFLGVGFGMDFLIPVPILPNQVQYALGGTILVGSFLIMPFVLSRFRRAKTTFDARKGATALITTGPYRYTRNPSYISLTMLQLGIGIAADNIWVLAGLVPAVLMTHYGVILKEEKYLDEKFGEAYRDYKRSVRRWL